MTTLRRCVFSSSMIQWTGSLFKTIESTASSAYCQRLEACGQASTVYLPSYLGQGCWSSLVSLHGRVDDHVHLTLYPLQVSNRCPPLGWPIQLAARRSAESCDVNITFVTDSRSWTMSRGRWHHQAFRDRLEHP